MHYCSPFEKNITLKKMGFMATNKKSILAVNLWTTSCKCVYFAQFWGFEHHLSPFVVLFIYFISQSLVC